MSNHKPLALCRSKFERFVRTTYGVDRLARGLDIRSAAIYQWLGCATVPKPAHVVIIQRLAREAGVKLTFEQIYQHARDLRAGEAVGKRAQRRLASRTCPREMTLRCEGD